MLRCNENIFLKVEVQVDIHFHQFMVKMLLLFFEGTGGTLLPLGCI